jgi:hypothetical protein
LPSFKYKKQESRIFGEVFRPLIKLEIYSELKKKWLTIQNVLADTGADLSIMPRDIGEALLQDISKGKIEEIKGIVPFARLIVYIHKLKFKINGIIFRLPVAIAESSDVPPILGRVKGLDLFKVVFDKGKKVIMTSR